jgi:hypothetical protein
MTDEALITLIQYMGMQYIVRFQGLSKMWYSRIQQFYDNFCKPMEKSFQDKYYDLLTLVKSKTVVTRTQFGNQKGLRIDRIFEIQLKDSAEVSRRSGGTLKLENMYRY